MMILIRSKATDLGNCVNSCMLNVLRSWCLTVQFQGDDTHVQQSNSETSFLSSLYITEYQVRHDHVILFFVYSITLPMRTNFTDKPGAHLNIYNFRGSTFYNFFLWHVPKWKLIWHLVFFRDVMLHHLVKWFPTSPDNMVILCSGSKYLRKIFTDISTLEDETIMSSWNGCGVA